MDDVVQFLRDRLDETRKSEEGRRRSIPSPFDGHEVVIQRDEDQGVVVLVDGHPYPTEQYWEAATEPASDPFSMADIRSKQALLDEHSNVNDGSCGTCVDGQWGYPTHGGSSPQNFPCRTLRLLALPYANHPDYNEAWRP
jgi:hypothetical protein